MCTRMLNMSEGVWYGGGCIFVFDPHTTDNREPCASCGCLDGEMKLPVVLLVACFQLSLGWRPQRSRTITRTRNPRRTPPAPRKKLGKVDESSKSSMASSVFNLVNNVAGAGLLALSAGQAAGTGWVPSVLIATALGLLSAHTFILIGEACEATGESDFKGLWTKTLGGSTTWVVDAIISTLCLAVGVIYAGILGDVFTGLFGQYNLVPKQHNHRSTNIIAIISLILYPLSLLKNLSALAFTSILGFASILYTVLFITIRSLDGSYALGTGRFVSDSLIPHLPTFGKSSLMNIDFTSLVLASNFGLAYVAHYNGPSFYRELRNTNSKRFATMVSIGFSILIGLYLLTMGAGYSTFGDVCQGNILLNYHPADALATAGRFATGFSILFGFPLIAAGAREGLQNMASTLLGRSLPHVPLVSAMLFLITAIACTVSDVSLAVGLTGAALGSAICYICPALIYTRAVKGPHRYNKLLVPFGISIAALGVYMTLAEAG